MQHENGYFLLAPSIGSKHYEYPDGHEPLHVEAETGTAEITKVIFPEERHDFSDLAAKLEKDAIAGFEDLKKVIGVSYDRSRMTEGQEEAWSIRDDLLFWIDNNPDASYAIQELVWLKKGVLPVSKDDLEFASDVDDYETKLNRRVAFNEARDEVIDEVLPIAIERAKVIIKTGQYAVHEIVDYQDYLSTLEEKWGFDLDAEEVVHEDNHIKPVHLIVELIDQIATKMYEELPSDDSPSNNIIAKIAKQTGIQGLETCGLTSYRLERYFEDRREYGPATARAMLVNDIEQKTITPEDQDDEYDYSYGAVGEWQLYLRELTEAFQDDADTYFKVAQPIRLDDLHDEIVVAKRVKAIIDEESGAENIYSEVASFKVNRQTGGFSLIA